MKYLELFEDYTAKAFGYTDRKKFANSMNILDIDRCIDYVIENCTEFIERPIKIARAIYFPDTSYFYSEPLDRVSRDNANYYTILMDNDDEWREYPKRGKCFCCTLFMNHQIAFYDTYLVIPINNSKWGVCRTDDLYYSFDNISKYASNIKRFFNLLNDLSYDIGLGGISDNNIIEMKQDILKLQNKLYEFENIDMFINHLKDIKSDWDGLKPMDDDQNILQFFRDFWGKNIFDEISRLINPKDNDFKLEKYTSLNNDGNEREVWTDSPCVFIYSSNINYFLTKLGEKTNKKIEL